MQQASLVTVINEKNLRGVVGPTSAISEELLKDIMDLVRYSSSQVSADVNRRFKNTKRLVDGRELRTSLRAM